MDEVTDSFEVRSLWTGVCVASEGNGDDDTSFVFHNASAKVHVSQMECVEARAVDLSFPMELSGDVARNDGLW